MGEHEMIVRERHPKHRSGQDTHNRALQFDGFFGAHGGQSWQRAGARLRQAPAINRFTGDYRRTDALLRKGADALRVDELHSRLARGH